MISVDSHPIIAHDLARLRSESLSCAAFSKLLRTLGTSLAHGVTADLRTAAEIVLSPRGEAPARRLAVPATAIVPVLRSGLVLATGLQEVLPSFVVGHIGLYRDKKKGVLTEYLISLPSLESRLCILVDPVIATGDTMRRAIKILLINGAQQALIRVLSVVVSAQGGEAVSTEYPEVRIHCAAIDRGAGGGGLNRDRQVVPGLGLVSERLFGFSLQL